ncbi:hypothetical protein ROJ8625_01081 [Roseivivax jejudonensis]|uniref:Cytochrome b561 bacterial/Ni-hydrogenase domain-containing protein n=1 Tax=Roseivivax jejudonensis TaxID=1529041 RepID=A0A1X6YPF0_9RHOB|nr:cytochrome b [Roseivivax jejudonensis]SLN26676.1 hypothetical protein ROJ8625_01081 [Roseivivax jejudonensis]
MSVQGYSTTARLFHWLVAAAVLLMIPIGFIMIRDGVPRSISSTLFILHKNGGVIVFLIVVARLLYRWRHPAPPLPDEVPGWQRAASVISHAALYVMLVAMPVLGYVRVRAGGFPIEWLDALNAPTLVPENEALAETAKTLHYYGALVIVALIAVHVSAAIYHAKIRRDGVFFRMWPPFGRAQ